VKNFGKLVFGLMVVVVTLSSSLFAFKAIMVTDTGGLGDKSFNDGTWAGIKKAASELKIEAKVIVSNEQTDYIPNLSKAAEEVMKEKDGGIVFAVGFLLKDALEKVARQYPSVYFGAIDFTLDQPLPNVVGFLFKEHEGTFFVGYVAAAMTLTGNVGFIGGMRIPPVERYRIGYEAGVKAYSQLRGKKVKVVVGYTNEFSDPKKGKELALSQYSQGVDVILAAAGASGLGIFEAAKERSEAVAGKGFENIKKAALAGKRLFYAIGGDMDQDYIVPGLILTSALKRVDVASYLGVKWAYSGEFKGGTVFLGLKEDAVGWSEMKYTKDVVLSRAPWLLDDMNYLKELIISGKIVIPDNDNDLKIFNVSSVKLPK